MENFSAEAGKIGPWWAWIGFVVRSLVGTPPELPEAGGCWKRIVWIRPLDDAVWNVKKDTTTHLDSINPPTPLWR